MDGVKEEGRSNKEQVRVATLLCVIEPKDMKAGSCERAVFAQMPGPGRRN